MTYGPLLFVILRLVTPHHVRRAQSDKINAVIDSQLLLLPGSRAVVTADCYDDVKRCRHHQHQQQIVRLLVL